MGRSQETFNKKEREKKRQKKKKEKRDRRARRKEEGFKSAEFMYLDADGNLTETPPDPALKVEVDIESIDISVPKSEKSDTPNFLRSGIVKFFNTEKGYGFIVDSATQDSMFVHMDGCIDTIRDNDKVTFEIGKGPKGPIAKNVKLS